MKKVIKKIKEKIRSKTDLYFILHKICLPLKVLKNKKRYEKQYIKTINDIERANKKKIFFIGVPVHSNIGDLAQYYCITNWIKENYADYNIIEIADNIIYINYNNLIKKITKIIGKDDIFVFQSGYRTTDVANFEGNYAHQRILKKFKNKVIVFPQTINYKSKKELKKCKIAYKKNNNYVFLARDEISYKTACEIMDEKRVLLYPDIVTTLIGNCNLINKNNQKDGILLCLRNDGEKLYTDIEYKNLIENLKTITCKIDITDTNSNKNFEFDKSQCESELQLKLNQFSKYKLIITDRYHGTIFSLITSTPVIVLNSTDHKVSSGVKWFKNSIYSNYVVYSDNLSKVLEFSKNIYDKRIPKIEEPYFKKNYYEKLYNNINTILISKDKRNI